MKSIASNVNYAEDFRHLIELDSLTRMLPRDFKACSQCGGSIQVNPDTSRGEILEKFKDHELLQSLALDGLIRYAFLDKENRLVMLSLNGRNLEVEVSSPKHDADAVTAELIKRLEGFRLDNAEDDGVWLDVCFWNGGVRRNTEFIKAPHWKDIRDNYPMASDIEKMVLMEKPWERGRIIVWHGPPGTGKTYAIRSLLMKWRENFNFVVVADPENLTKNPAYYYEVASESREEPRNRKRKKGRSLSLGEKVGEEQNSGGRTLFILEDSADLIMPESRAAHYDKVNKFLNITDGIIGQGREDIFLITFNEKEASVDPAFMRAGRCISKLEFPLLDEADAREWMEKRGVDAPQEIPQTLADLYAHAAKDERKTVPV